MAGGSILLNKKTRTVATCLGGWILLMDLVIYGPVLVVALSDPSTAVKVERINFCADTLLFAGAILALAKATARSDVVSGPVFQVLSVRRLRQRAPNLLLQTKLKHIHHLMMRKSIF